MDSQEYKALQTKVLKTKKDLKKWEATFSKKYGRPPAIKDIGQRPNVEKIYKEYNQLKKQLKQETEKLNNDSQSIYSPPAINDTQETVDSTTASPERLSTRRNSVEFIRSPSHPMSRTKSMFDSKQQQVNVRRLSESEEMRNALAASSSSQEKRPTNNRQLTEDEAFWLGVSSNTNSKSEFASFSQPLPSSSFSTFNFSQEHTSSTQQPKRLVLGGSSSQQQPKRKKNTLKQQKLFGRNPFQRAISSSQELFDDTASLPSVMPTSSQLSQPMSELIMDDDNDDDMEGLEIVNHEINPFKNYDPSLFHWEDPGFSVGPGFFSSEKASSCFTIPMLNESKRRNRVLYKLEKGTLGEVLEENQNMEEDLEEDIREFISTNSRLDPNSFESALTSIDENLLNTTEYIYKKKPLQKRQTRLFKLKFVDTRSS